MSHHDVADDPDHEPKWAVHTHIAEVRFYAMILGILMALTLLTIGVSYIHLGKLNLIVAVVIASIKASLVVLFFMHLKYDSKFNALIMVISLLFIGVFFAYTLNDTEHRGELDLDQGVKVLPSTGEPAPGGFEGHGDVTATGHGGAGGHEAAGHEAPAHH